jgi:hypothetical protein
VCEAEINQPLEDGKHFLSFLLFFKWIFISKTKAKNVNKWLTKENLCKFFRRKSQPKENSPREGKTA